MPNDMPVYNTLTSVESRIVQTMRAFTYQGVAGTAPDAPDEIADAIGMPLSRFIGLLWCSDPYAVDLHHELDPDVSCFELQVLYAISEARAGNEATVKELLQWWYPDDLAELAGNTLTAIACILDDIGAPRQSSDRLREHLLNQSSRRRGTPASFVLHNDTSAPAPGRTGPKTIH